MRNKPTITFSETIVTPKQAAEWLAALNDDIERGAFSQRKPSKLAVARMAADMKRGNFALTHQAIAFNNSGFLIDGRQRLMSVVSAAVPVKMVVATNVPDSHDSVSVSIPTLDIIDSGRNRTLGQVLSGIHLIENGHLIAAILRTVCELVTRNTMAITKPQGMELKQMIGEEIALVIEAASNGEIERRASVLAPFVIGALAERALTIEFVEQFCKVENIKPQSPVLALRRWLTAKCGSSGKQRRASSLVTCNALVEHYSGKKCESLHPTFDGIDAIVLNADKFTKKIKTLMEA